MVIRVRGKRGKSANLPAPCPGIERVSSICILGFTVNDQLSAADYVNSLLASSNSLLYALRVLRVHGITDVSLQEVFRTTLLAKMTYACPAWHGMCSAGDHAKLVSLVNRNFVGEMCVCVFVCVCMCVFTVVEQVEHRSQWGLSWSKRLLQTLSNAFLQCRLCSKVQQWASSWRSMGHANH